MTSEFKQSYTLTEKLIKTAIAQYVERETGMRAANIERDVDFNITESRTAWNDMPSGGFDIEATVVGKIKLKETTS